MSVIDKLLQMDAGKLTELPEKEIEIKSLSEKLGEPVFFKCRAIDGKRYAEIKRQGIDLSKKGTLKDIDMHIVHVLTILAGVVEPDLKNKALIDHYGVVTPKDLVEKMLLSGEIEDLRTAIEELSGYEPDDDEEDEGDSEIKNLLRPTETSALCTYSSGIRDGSQAGTTGYPPESSES